MKKLMGIFLAGSFILSLAFMSEAITPNGSNPFSVKAAQVTVKKKRKKGIIRTTYAGGKYVTRKVWNGTKWVSKKVWVGTKYAGKKTWKGGRMVVSRTKKIVY